MGKPGWLKKWWPEGEIPYPKQVMRLGMPPAYKPSLPDAPHF